MIKRDTPSWLNMVEEHKSSKMGSRRFLFYLDAFPTKIAIDHRALWRRCKSVRLWLRLDPTF